VIVSCFSKNSNSFEAGKELGSKLEGCEYVLLFAHYTYNFKDLIRGITSRTKCKITGCSSAEVISNGRIIERGAAALGISSRDLVIGSAAHNIQDGYKAGRAVARNALEDLSEKENRDKLINVFARYSAIVSNVPERLPLSKPYFYLFAFMDPFYMTDEKVIDGIRSRIQCSSPLLGGSAYGDYFNKSNYQILNNTVYDKSVVLNVIATNKSFGFGSESAFTPTSRKPYLVTRADDRIVYEMNYKSALDLYSEMCGKSKEELIKEEAIGLSTGAEFPFMMVDNKGKPWMKYPAIANSDGSITFGNRTPTGSVLFSAESTKESVLKSAEKSIKTAIGQVKNPQVIIIFDCWHRRFILKDDIMEEEKVIKECVKDIPTIGFYTMGEYLPLCNLCHVTGSITTVVLGD